MTAAFVTGVTVLAAPWPSPWTGKWLAGEIATGIRFHIKGRSPKHRFSFVNAICNWTSALSNCGNFATFHSFYSFLYNKSNQHLISKEMCWMQWNEFLKVKWKYYICLIEIHLRFSWPQTLFSIFVSLTHMTINWDETVSFVCTEHFNTTIL